MRKEIIDVLAEHLSKVIVIEASLVYDNMDEPPPIPVTKEQFIIGYGMGVIHTMGKLNKIIFDENREQKVSEKKEYL